MSVFRMHLHAATTVDGRDRQQLEAAGVLYTFISDAAGFDTRSFYSSTNHRAHGVAPRSTHSPPG